MRWVCALPCPWRPRSCVGRACPHPYPPPGRGVARSMPPQPRARPGSRHSKARVGEDPVEASSAFGPALTQPIPGTTHAGHRPPAPDRGRSRRPRARSSSRLLVHEPMNTLPFTEVPGERGGPGVQPPMWPSATASNARPARPDRPPAGSGTPLGDRQRGFLPSRAPGDGRRRSGPRRRVISRSEDGVWDRRAASPVAQRPSPQFGPRGRTAAPRMGGSRGSSSGAPIPARSPA